MPKLNRRPLVLNPFWQTTDGETVRLFLGDVLFALRQMPSKSVHCVVTSPPYWGLRDYGTGVWYGGDESCDHRRPPLGGTKRSGLVSVQESFDEDGYTTAKTQPNTAQYKEICGKCGAKRIDLQIGSEATPQEFVDKMVEVFAEVRRVLRDDGILWLNLGDSYTGSASSGGQTLTTAYHERKLPNKQAGLSSGNLVGIPWRVALALQADGWILRQEVPWVKRCLSGGTSVYARGQTGDKPMVIRDLARLDPSTVKLWDGNKWTQLLGVSRTKRTGTEIMLTLRSGERISCTVDHRFPISDGRVLFANDLKIGDKLRRCQLPEPENPVDPTHLKDDAAWLAGLYLAEGCKYHGRRTNSGSLLTGHANEHDRWVKVKRIVESYGGSAKLKIKGNIQKITISGRVINAVISQFIVGKSAGDKSFHPSVWQYSNRFIESLMMGYLEGDGGKDVKNNRWRLGFKRNYNLESDIRTACARLGWRLTLSFSTAKNHSTGEEFPAFRGEIRFSKETGHSGERDRNEIVKISKATCREVYDLSVADEPNLFSLSSGILTHNSPMPESVKNRPAKALEHVFMFVKRMDYYYDDFAVKRVSATPGDERHLRTDKRKEAADGCPDDGSRKSTGNPTGQFRNFWQTDLWFDSVDKPHGLTGVGDELVGIDVTTAGYAGAHFATYPKALIEPFIMASTSEHGCCADCGAPWKRIVESKAIKRDRPNDYTKRTGEDGTGNSCANSVAGTESRTVGWRPDCECHGKLVKRKKVVTRGVVVGNVSDKNAQRLAESMQSSKSTDGGLKNADREEVEQEISELVYESDLSLDRHPVVPCTVLDPFIGAATTTVVCLDNGRRCWGIDLSEKYLLNNAIPRVEGVLMSRPDTAGLVATAAAEPLDVGEDMLFE